MDLGQVCPLLLWERRRRLVMCIALLASLAGIGDMAPATRAEHLPPPAVAALSGRGNGSRHTNPCDILPNTTTIGTFGTVATIHGTSGFVITESGDYSLGLDLQLNNQDIGILILAEHVTLDLNERTISDPGTSATLIRVVGTKDVTVRNGMLQGGARAVVATANRFSTNTRLTLNRLAITGSSSSSFEGLVTDGVFDVRVLHNSIHGTDNGINIVSGSVATIEGNRIDVRELGIRMVSLLGNVRMNTVRAADALTVHGGTLVERNTLIGSAHGTGIRLAGADNRVIRNRIRGTGGACAISIMEPSNWVVANRIEGEFESLVCVSRGSHMIQNNILVGGTQAAIDVSAGAVRIAKNSIISPSAGVLLAGC